MDIDIPLEHKALLHGLVLMVLDYSVQMILRCLRSSISATTRCAADGHWRYGHAEMPMRLLFVDSCRAPVRLL
jgi:hypothetical protein